MSEQQLRRRGPLGKGRLGMDVVCAWCSRVLHDGVWCYGAVDGALPVTHGICPMCLGETLARRERSRQ